MTKTYISHKIRFHKPTQRPILMRHKRLYHGLPLTYTLRAQADRTPTDFSIEIALGNERSCHNVGSDLMHAITCFWRIVRGGVTPCTLGEILLDMQNEELF